jgi:hypothetical protein
MSWSHDQQDSTAAKPIIYVTSCPHERQADEVAAVSLVREQGSPVSVQPYARTASSQLSTGRRAAGCVYETKDHGRI